MPEKRDQSRHEALKPTDVHERGYPSGGVPTSQIHVPADALRPHPRTPPPAEQSPGGEAPKPPSD